jgi:chromate transporter
MPSVSPETLGVRPPRPVARRHLFLAFLQIGAVSVGGGSSGWIHREIVTRKGWLSQEDFLAGLAIAQALPGVNTTNLTVFVGRRLNGWTGAVAALGGFLFAPFWMTILAAVAYRSLLRLAGFDAAMVGVAAVALGMVLRVGLISARRSLASPLSFGLMVAAFVCVGLLQWPIIPVVVGLGAIGLIGASRFRGREHE